MLTIEEAFRKFKSRLELTEQESRDASRRQQEIREHLDGEFSIDDDFLTGSYRRWTKTKPLKDVDIFVVLGEQERHYRSKSPAKLLEAFSNSLARKYGRKSVSLQRRSVSVEFGVAVAEDDSDGHVMSFDVVPSFADGEDFEIPDTQASNGWTKTNPKVHEQKAVDAHEAFKKEWKSLVRMMKYWNNGQGKPIKPSFLIEVMALEILHPPFQGDFDREMQAFFYSMADRIGETWHDPAGLGPPVSDAMNSSERAAAKVKLLSAGAAATVAIRLARTGKTGAALQEWRSLLGPLFPLS